MNTAVHVLWRGIQQQLPIVRSRLRLLGAAHDITDSKEVEIVLARALEKEREAAAGLRELDRMRNSFLESVSHEMRTPLTAIIGLGRTLLRPDAPEHFGVERQRMMLERIVANGERLDALLSDLLEFDRGGNGVLELRRRPTPLRALVCRVVDHVPLAGRRLELEVQDASALVSPAHSERLLECLLLNAVKHTPPDTPIRLEVRTIPDGMFIAVGDRGDGVPDDRKEQIFEPFVRGDGPAARAGGSGMGLALVDRFAQMHGGKAWVEDRRGGGSVFKAFLPDHAGTADGDDRLLSEAQSRAGEGF